MRFIRALKTLMGFLAVIFVGIVVTLFVGLPRVANMLADLLGTGAEEPAHWIPVAVVWLLLLLILYFWVWRPWRQFTYAQEAQGLVVQRGQGRAYMDTESVRQQVYSAVAKVVDIQRAEVTINNDLGRALVQVNVLTGNDINGPKKKQEISREIKKVVQDQLGIQLAGEPVINISLTPIGGDVPYAVPTTVPQVSRSPVTSPRTVPEPVSRPMSVPAERPEPPSTPPVATPRPTEAITVTPEPPPSPKIEQPPEQTGASESPITGSRPFARRPFEPPGGSTMLPDLPEPRPTPMERDEEAAEEEEATMDDEGPSASAMAGDEDTAEDDENRADSSTGDNAGSSSQRENLE